MLSIHFGKTTEDLCDKYCDGYKESSGKQIKGMVDWLFERKDNFLGSTIVSLRKNSIVRTKLNELKVKLTKTEIKNILFCKYSDLKSKSKEYEDYNFDFWIAKDSKQNLLKTIFDYTIFRKYRKTIINGFWLSENLGIECCPYCNRNHTSSHQTFYQNIKNESQEKYVFPEFDHFYPKEKNPVLALSFYNLIPSCNICNSHFKNGRDPEKVFHPYKQVGHNHFSFKGFPNDVSTLYGAGKDITLGFEYNCDVETETEIKKSIDFFGIKDSYEKCHSNLIEDIIYKRLAFSDRYIIELQKTYKISFEEAYKILFETYFEDDKHYKRPFSKLKKDIFKNLNPKK